MTLLAATLMLLPAGYLAWRFSSAISALNRSAPRFLRLLPLLVLCTLFIYPFIGLTDWLVTGGVDMFAYPQWTSYWFWFGLLALFQVAGWILVLDLLRLILLRFSGWDRSVLNRNWGVTVAAVTVAGLLWTGYRAVSDTTNIGVEEYVHRTGEEISSLQGLRIVHISDVQGDEFTGREQIRRYVDRVNDLEPHLVVFTGDLISYGTDFIEMSAEELGRIQAPLGTYAVVGDHDYWAGLLPVGRALERYGITLLQDETVQIWFESSEVALTGVTHVYSQRSDPETLRPQMERGAAADLSLMAVHQTPDELVELAQEYEYDWLFGGHSHGGQLHVPILFWDFAAPELENRYLKGHYRANGLDISINSGLGFTLIPLRYNAPPRITRITVE